MPIELQGQTSSTRSVFFGSPSEYVEGAVVGLASYEMKDFQTGEIMVSKKTGKPRMQDRVLLLVTDAADSLMAGPKGSREPVAVGDVVAVYVKGMHRFAYYEAKKAHGAVNVGDIQRHTFTDEEDTGKGNPRKNLSVTMARCEDAELLAAAEGEYTDRLSSTELQSADSAVYADEEPF